MVEHFHFSVHVVAVSADSLQTDHSIGVVQASTVSLTLTLTGTLTVFLSQPSVPATYEIPVTRGRDSELFSGGWAVRREIGLQLWWLYLIYSVWSPGWDPRQ